MTIFAALVILLTAHSSLGNDTEEVIGEGTTSWLSNTALTSLCGGIVTLLFLLVVKDKFSKAQAHAYEKEAEKGRSVKVFYGTQTGNAQILAEKLFVELKASGYSVEVINLKRLEPEECLLREVKVKGLCLFIISTSAGGCPPEEAQWFCDWLKDTYADFRVQKSYLQGLDFAIYGLGDSAYAENYNKVAKDVFFWLSKLGGRAVLPLCLNDESVDEGKYGTGRFAEWKEDVTSYLRDGTLQTHKEKKVPDEVYETSSDEEKDVVDLEDLAGKSNGVEKKATQQKTQMITPVVRASLTKQGYRLIGSHSGVKLCRWTKSMLRGRGGCYKHTFYGIESHRCMETTPSLACANKCVFCWRHHTNPVGTEWKWDMDPPEMIVDAALNNHYKMIKEFRGVPGVQQVKLEEATRVRHCALSLVGEPIMYPEINALVRLLHERGISTFLVTNAQFPDAIAALEPVTQLYVSVDASSEETLKKIDRPLFRDFWKRFRDSLSALSQKGQRTVYRLTLVKEWNMEELQGYASLVQLGRPDFIEIKGVTYCGESKGSNLTMQNIPWHEEVVSFVEKLVALIPEYSLASEHEHSNCVLLAHRKFQIDGKWHTWIDYDRFHELIERWRKSNGAESFTSEDYTFPTPAWAVYGARERGFDPKESRLLRKSRKDIGGC
ncbi:S-adenosyl-L-methionine-dependent tRNA 4-demethylwyosine synthase TYW1-like [Ornithodoros turicata]|uniref:S-adenosyl-L-methionine-dependent tRNA 4-demethylwyosine synthase TYW1-like n=1 Tax=Ornithodoros turicata TaxID=34597 RepID=UPI003138B9DC